MSAPRETIEDLDVARFHEALSTSSTRQGWAERLLRSVIRSGFRVASWRVEIDLDALPCGGGRRGAGCVVVVAPHRAWLEPFLLMAAWPSDAARLIWLADGRTVTRSWWRRRLLPRLGVIPIRGQRGSPRAYATLARTALVNGAALVVFPETGPASPPDRTRRISPGFAYLALGAGAPVVPVVVGGSHHIVRGSTFTLDVLDAIETGPASEDVFSPEARGRAHAVSEEYAAITSTTLPVRNAHTDALRPRLERWRWLGTLFR